MERSMEAFGGGGSSSGVPSSGEGRWKLVDRLIDEID